jgi:large subunit ribosomal protein L21
LTSGAGYVIILFRGPLEAGLVAARKSGRALAAKPDRGGKTNMYAVFETGGKQYRVKAGDILSVERLKAETGERIEFDKVLAYSDGASLSVGKPYLSGVKAVGKVLENGKGRKLVIFKFKAKKDYRKKQGHRQLYTMIEIESFIVNGQTAGKIKAKETAPTTPEAEEESA